MDDTSLEGKISGLVARIERDQDPVSTRNLISCIRRVGLKHLQGLPGIVLDTVRNIIAIDLKDFEILDKEAKRVRPFSAPPEGVSYENLFYECYDSDMFEEAGLWNMSYANSLTRVQKVGLRHPGPMDIIKLWGGRSKKDFPDMLHDLINQISNNRFWSRYIGEYSEGRLLLYKDCSSIEYDPKSESYIKTTKCQPSAVFECDGSQGYFQGAADSEISRFVYGGSMERALPLRIIFSENIEPLTFEFVSNSAWHDDANLTNLHRVVLSSHAPAISLGVKSL